MKALARSLVEWYRENKIAYPWRKTRNPYPVWISEILLQQTRIPVVLKYYDSILRRFPTIQDLAAASYDEFSSYWSGIGYYSRAKNMHQCAREIVEKHDGNFPPDRASLLSLPGIGPYTAGALLNLCFNRLSPAIDGNIARVLARITASSLRPESPSFHRSLEQEFLKLGEESPTSEFFQSLMELGETICLPQPRCTVCPVRRYCAARKKGIADQIPAARARKTQQEFHWFFFVFRGGNDLLLAQNSRRAFLQRAWIFPDVLSEQRLTVEKAAEQFQKTWKMKLRNLHLAGTIRHSVTFRKITGHVILADLAGKKPAFGKWMSPEEITAHHTSSVTGKILKLLRDSS